MKTEIPTSNSAGTQLGPTQPAVPFGVNEVRLNARQWLAVILIIAVVAFLVPRLWTRLERFDTGPDYRIPYELSKDYWLYARRLNQATGPGKIVVLGDSVVWGEYVSPDGTLSHFLNQEAGTKEQFINGGLNGLFPLAQEGLVNCWASSLRHKKVLLHCNLLWMTSPKADLSTEKEEKFNHSRLVPQFFPRIPCYKADANDRLTAIVERNNGFLGWVQHLQNAYFGQKSILQWTLEEDGSEPPRFPNAAKNPFSQITLRVPSAPREDPQRGPKSPRHKPWSDTGVGIAQFEWVDLDASLQWQAFRRIVRTLENRGNDVLVVLGPFNEHIMAAENRPTYRKLRDGVEAWLAQNRIPHVAPEVLPSALYADASHPLTNGYELLAKRILQSQDFQKWWKQ
jgi:hypothetical protein